MSLNDRNDGGPAYPRVYLAIAQGENVTLDATHPYDLPEGMSLRDWFAGQAPPLPPEVVPAGSDRPRIHGFDALGLGSAVFEVRVQSWARLHALWRIAFADAMLEARKP